MDHPSGLNYQDLITVDFNLLMLLIVFIDGDLWPFMHCEDVPARDSPVERHFEVQTGSEFEQKELSMEEESSLSAPKRFLARNPCQASCGLRMALDCFENSQSRSEAKIILSRRLSLIW